MESIHNAILLMLGCTIFLTGILLLACPGMAARMNLPLNQALPWLKSCFHLERYYYRHHKISGPLTIAGGVMLVWVSLFFSRQAFDGFDDNEMFFILYEVMVIMFFIAGAGITVFGLIVSVRPSLLKPFESWANQPLTRELIFYYFRSFRKKFSSTTAKYPRILGLAAAASGLILIAAALK